MRIFSYHTYSNGFWFRIFGYGLTFRKYKNPNDAPFSVRNGYRGKTKLFGYHIDALKP